MHNKDFIKNEYLKQVDNYDVLGTTLKMNLEALLKEEDIGFLSVTYRVKEIDSLLEKVERKTYSDVFKEIEDFCGVRIICYYTTDLKKIDDLIEKNFNVESTTYKENELGDDKFGYLSNHYIIKLKEEWCSTPTNACCKDLKAEIQVRTILMHAWADISHKLNYKTEHDSPQKLRRKLNQLSALFEIADGHFVELWEMKEKYIEEKMKQIHSPKIEVEEENIDSLQAILDFYFPKRSKSKIDSLFKEIKDYNLKFLDLIEGIEKITIETLNKIEEEESEIYDVSLNWAQVGAMRTVMMLISKDYFQNAIDTPVESVMQKWYKELKMAR